MKSPAIDLSTLNDDQLAQFAKVAQGRAKDYQRLAAAHQSAADTYRKEQRRRKRAKKEAHKLLDEADAVCHYNGRKFDIPVLEAEFLTHGFRPPSPFHQIDLYGTAKRFALPSRKLDYISQHLDLGRKTKHKGMELWTACMGGDSSAWRVMERYNRQDIRLLERLYTVLRPWIKDHPNHSITDGECCPTCGSHNIRWKGWRESITRRYRRFVCNECGSWGRAVRAEPGSAKTRSLA